MLHSLVRFLPTVDTRLVVTMHDYHLVCPKGTFVHNGADCDGPGLASASCVRAANTARCARWPSRQGSPMTRRSKRRVDRYIAVSGAVAQACASVAAESDRPIQVIPPFIPDDSFQMGT